MDKFRRVVGILLIIIGVVIIGDVAYKKIITLKHNLVKSKHKGLLNQLKKIGVKSYPCDILFIKNCFNPSLSVSLSSKYSLESFLA